MYIFTGPSRGIVAFGQDADAAEGEAEDLADGEDDGTVTSEEDEPAPDAPTDVTETEKVSCCRCFLDLPRAFICTMQYTCRNRS